MKQKTLDFFVDEQFIRAPHHKVVADSRGFLTARFSFGEAWRGLTKTAVFLGADGRAYHVLLTDDTCEVPPQVLRPTQFFVSVFGGDRLTTDRVAVEVAASGFAEGITPPPTTPDIYSQLTAVFTEKQQAAETAAKTAEAGARAAETANAAAQDALTKVNTAAVTAAVSADSAESYARASEFFAAQSTEGADAAAMAKEAAETAAVAAAEDAASAVNSATAAEQSATAAAASAAAAAQSAQGLATVGALTLIDSVTLTEAVSVYNKALPKSTYREVTVTVDGKINLTAAKTVDTFFQETISGYRVAMVTAPFSDGARYHCIGRLIGMPSRGTAGELSVGQSYYDGTMTFKPGARNTDNASGYVEGATLSLANAVLAAGTRIKLWGR